MPPPSTDGHGDEANKSLLMAAGREGQLICTSRPARQPRQTGTCRRQREPRVCSPGPGAQPAPPGCSAPAAARQKGAQRRCSGPQHRSLSLVPHALSPACLEVDGVDTQVVGVQVAELRQGLAEVAQVTDSFAQGVQHFGAVATDLVGARRQVKVGEVGLGLGENSEQPAGAGGSVPDPPHRPPWSSHPLAPSPMGSLGQVCT